MPELQTAPLAPDCEYFLDAALEHEELDATAQLVLKLYGPRLEIMAIVDEPFTHDGRDRMKRRLSTCDRLTALADSICRELPPDVRGPLAWAGVRHVKHCVAGTANMMACWAQEDMIKGGCGEPFKRARSHAEWKRIDAYVTTPKQQRRLYAPGWIRRYVRLSPDKQRLRVTGDLVRSRTAGVSWETVRSASDKIAELLQAQHEAYRRTNERQIRQWADTHVHAWKPSRQARKRSRKVAVKAATMAASVLGQDNLARWIAGQPVTIAGATVAFEVARVASSATMGHGGLILTAVDPQNHRKLANMCLYHEGTPALDQLTALALAVSAGEEQELIATANLSNVTELGSKHPLIEGHKSARREQPWRPRDKIAEKNEAYWLATKPIWLDALGTHVLGRDWKVLA